MKQPTNQYDLSSQAWQPVLDSAQKWKWDSPHFKDTRFLSRKTNIGYQILSDSSSRKIHKRYRQITLRRLLPADTNISPLSGPITSIFANISLRSISSVFGCYFCAPSVQKRNAREMVETQLQDIKLENYTKEKFRVHESRWLWNYTISPELCPTPALGIS